eukprot:1822511-Rhodomonas_salina.3
MYHIFQSCIARTADECRSSPAHILYPSFSTPPILLCMSYASSGTDTAYAATQYLLSSESLTASKVVPASFCTYPRSICLLLYCPMQYQPASVCQCLGTASFCTDRLYRVSAFFCTALCSTVLYYNPLIRSLVLTWLCSGGTYPARSTLAFPFQFGQPVA